jgi:hypothetical protein
MKQNIVLASLVVVGFGCQQLAEVRDTREIPGATHA